MNPVERPLCIVEPSEHQQQTSRLPPQLLLSRTLERHIARESSGERVECAGHRVVEPLFVRRQQTQPRVGYSDPPSTGALKLFGSFQISPSAHGVSNKKSIRPSSEDVFIEVFGLTVGELRPEVGDRGRVAVSLDAIHKVVHTPEMVGLNFHERFVKRARLPFIPAEPQGAAADEQSFALARTGGELFRMCCDGKVVGRWAILVPNRPCQQDVRGGEFRILADSLAQQRFGL